MHLSPESGWVRMERRADIRATCLLLVEIMLMLMKAMLSSSVAREMMLGNSFLNTKLFSHSPRKEPAVKQRAKNLQKSQ